MEEQTAILWQQMYVKMFLDKLTLVYVNKFRPDKSINLAEGAL
jgi:hypothetical protein